jgi:hypothetical protein
VRIISRIHERFLIYCEKIYDISAKDLEVSYPSKEWTTLTWSFWLISDLQNLMLGSVSEKKRGLFFMNKIDRFSFHHDLSRKIYLYHLLRARTNKKNILIPEVGPCGFDVLIALAAGFQEISVYDCDQRFLDCCKSIWGDRVREYILSDSESFCFDKYRENYIIISPDWFHGSLENSDNVIKVESGKNFSSHIKLVSREMVKDFCEQINQVTII